MTKLVHKTNTITGRIESKIFETLDKNPTGVRWTDLIKEIKVYDSNLHPKTINGCVWKLIEKYPNHVYKPQKGLFRLIKYKAQ